MLKLFWEDYNYKFKQTELFNIISVPVSGIEIITTTENGTIQEYSLNYGNGKCDNLAELIENVKSSIIDFGELYKIYFEDGTVEQVVAPKGRK